MVAEPVFKSLSDVWTQVEVEEKGIIMMCFTHQ